MVRLIGDLRGIFLAGGEKAPGWGWVAGRLDGGPVASHEDGVHDGQGTADAEDEAEEDADECAGEEVHDDAMIFLCGRKIESRRFSAWLPA